MTPNTTTWCREERASEIARQAKGVRSVRNDIVVRQAQQVRSDNTG
jgi:hypothetical protein